jgi:hypothetical protein
LGGEFGGDEKNKKQKTRSKSFPFLLALLDLENGSEFWPADVFAAATPSR